MIWSSRIGCFHRQTWCFDQQTLWYTGDIMGITCPNWMKQMTTSLRRHWNDTYYGNYAKIALLCQFQRFIVIDAEKKNGWTILKDYLLLPEKHNLFGFHLRFQGWLFFKCPMFINSSPRPSPPMAVRCWHGTFHPPAGVHRALGPDVSPCSRPAEPIWASADWRSSCNAAHQVSTE